MRLLHPHPLLRYHISLESHSQDVSRHLLTSGNKREKIQDMMEVFK
jgi:hypothetical protein